ncbi:MAG: hypothetical protein ACREEQ_12630, partial [Caulobacteraceae bacterium]
MSHWRLAVLCLGAGLAACATRPSVPPSAAVPPSATAEDHSSLYGLFLAGETARDQGRLSLAASLLAHAAQAGGDTPLLKGQAFDAALKAGDVALAARLAPTNAASDPDRVRLGALTRGVEAMAEGRDADAYALFSAAPADDPFRGAALI